MEWLAAALRLPAFLFAVMLMCWAPLAAVLTGRINLLQRKRRNDIYQAARLEMDALRVKVVKAGAGQLYRGRCMYLANHRCWADFFADTVITEGRGMPLSRAAVAVAFPALILPLVAARAVAVFLKKDEFNGVLTALGLGSKSSGSFEAFNSWLDQQLEESPMSAFLCYPEGRRCTGQHSLPLKRGLLKYAHSRGLPVQAVLSSHKEAVLNEGARSAHFGVTVVTTYSEVLKPEELPDFEKFVVEVQRAWDAGWKSVHSADPAGLPEVRGSGHLMEYSHSEQARTAAAFLLSAVAFSASLWAALRLVLACVPSGWASLATALLALWCAASGWLATQPVQAGRWQQVQAGGGNMCKNNGGVAGASQSAGVVDVHAGASTGH